MAEKSANRVREDSRIRLGGPFDRNPSWLKRGEKPVPAVSLGFFARDRAEQLDSNEKTLLTVMHRNERATDILV